MYQRFLSISMAAFGGLHTSRHDSCRGTRCKSWRGWPRDSPRVCVPNRVTRLNGDASQCGTFYRDESCMAIETASPHRRLKTIGMK